MIEGNTKSGFHYVVDERIKNDWDFIEAFENVQTKGANFVDIKKILTMLLTIEGFEKLKEHVRSQNNGIADVNAITKEFVEICADEKLKN